LDVDVTIPAPVVLVAGNGLGGTVSDAPKFVAGKFWGVQKIAGYNSRSLLAEPPIFTGVPPVIGRVT
jgi:hypothetical protein